MPVNISGQVRAAIPERIIQKGNSSASLSSMATTHLYRKAAAENHSTLRIDNEIPAPAHFQCPGNDVSQRVIHDTQRLLTLLIRPSGKSRHMKIIAEIRGSFRKIVI